MRSVMDHVAALAKGRQIGRRVVGDIVVQVRAGEADERPAMAEGVRQVSRCRKIGPNASALAVAPRLALGVEPAPIGENADELAVGSSAMLARALGTSEADRTGEFAPIDGVEAPQLPFDRHNNPTLRPVRTPERGVRRPALAL